MKERIKISSVSYLNSTPFVYGIEKKLDKGLYQLELDIPSVCAEKLLTGKVDIGLVPVAIIPLLKEHHIISNYCIGAVGKVRSVMLYSNVELKQIKDILLDNQSRTSVILTKVLAKHFWNIAPEWINASEGFEKKISGNTGGVVIGDRTFAMENKFKYVYDLSEEWEKFTGFPFVFACWVSNRPIDSDFLKAFDLALQFGVNDITTVIENLKDLPADIEVVKDYLKNNISYSFDDKKKQGLEKFLFLSKSL